MISVHVHEDIDALQPRDHLSQFAVRVRMCRALKPPCN